MPTRVLALPGDEADVLDYLIREALAFERRLTGPELMAYEYGTRCASIRERREEHGGVWNCTPALPCAFCAWTSAL